MARTVTESYYSDESVTLYLGDALEVSQRLPDGAADSIVTSPPYFGLRDYGTEGQYGLENSPGEYVERMRVLFSELRRVLADDGTLWLNIGDSYAAPGGGYSPDAPSNVARRDGTAGKERFSGGATEHLRQGNGREARKHIKYGLASKNLLGIPWRTAFALQDDGWILRNAIIWNKPNAMPESVTDRLSGRYEHVFLFSKNRRYYFALDEIREPHAEAEDWRAGRSQGEKWRDAVALSEKSGLAGIRPPRNPLGRNPGDVWNLNTQPFSAAHFAVFPVQLPQRCILAGCAPKRCQECGHVPEPIIKKGAPPPEKKRRGRSADMLAESYQRSNLSGQEWNAWKAAHPDTVTGYTDCGHSAYRAGTVLDPFSGSGTTGLAAQRTGRKYVGIDLNREYLDLSLKTRLNQSALDFEEPA